jgi:F-type H+-transporting ATPase subunit epsilon
MKVRIYTLQKTLFEGEAVETIAKTTTGEIAILAHHEPLVTILRPSEVRIKTEGGGEEAIRIEGGFLEVRPDNSVVILAN